MINIKNFDSSLLDVGKKSYKGTKLYKGTIIQYLLHWIPHNKKY